MTRVEGGDVQTVQPMDEATVAATRGVSSHQRSVSIAGTGHSDQVMGGRGANRVRVINVRGVHIQRVRGSSNVRTTGLPLPLPLVATAMAVAAAIIPTATAIAATSTLCHQASNRISVRAGSRDVPDLVTGPAVGGCGVGGFNCCGVCRILIGPGECLGGPSMHCGASLHPWRASIATHRDQALLSSYL